MAEPVKLITLSPGSCFIYNNKVYTVMQHERLMTEVMHNHKRWAWPSLTVVHPL